MEPGKIRTTSKLTGGSNHPPSAATETIDLSDRSGQRGVAEDAGVVLLYAPDPAAVVSAASLPPGGLVLGRDPPPGGLRLPFGSVSRVHARLVRTKDRLLVEDLESRNGTYLNARRVERADALDGDELRIGEILLKVVTSNASRHAEYPLHGLVPPAPFQRLRGGWTMQQVRDQISKVAPADFSVLVNGETGSGKELVAAAIHHASARRGPFRAVNCAAIPASLLESELFGYKRGAFTGADSDKIGLVRSANEGTLFLDEIGDMPLDAQAKLLRTLEAREVTPLGSHKAERVDVRVVCATHRDLPAMIREERFRADLYARISTFKLLVPPLRDRKEDVYQLTRLFMEREGARTLAPSFMLGLCSYDWPFNVRELESAIRSASAIGGDVLDASHLPADIVVALEATPELDEAAGAVGARGTAPPESELRALLNEHGGNLASVARVLGKDRTQVHRWLKRYGIAPDDYRS